jgi:acyl carrier protein
VHDATEIEERVRRALGEVLDADLAGCERDRTLAEAPGIYYDSASVVECVVAIEAEFGIEVDFVEDDVRYAFRSIGTISDFVGRKLADSHALSPS